jgi:outer membrane protein
MTDCKEDLMQVTRSIGMVLALVLLLGRPALAEQRIGFVRSDELVSAYGATQGALAQLQKEVEGWRQEGSEMEQELAKLIEDYQGRSAMLTATSRKQEEEKITRKRVALDEFVQRYFGPDGKAEKRRAELLRPVENAILAAIKVIAEREKYDMVLDASNAGVVWASTALDLTDQVSAELTNSAPVESGK